MIKKNLGSATASPPWQILIMLFGLRYEFFIDVFLTLCVTENDVDGCLWGRSHLPWGQLPTAVPPFSRPIHCNECTRSWALAVSHGSDLGSVWHTSDGRVRVAIDEFLDLGMKKYRLGLCCCCDKLTLFCSKEFNFKLTDINNYHQCLPNISHKEHAITSSEMTKMTVVGFQL